MDTNMDKKIKEDIESIEKKIEKLEETYKSFDVYDVKSISTVQNLISRAYNDKSNYIKLLHQFSQDRVKVEKMKVEIEKLRAEIDRLNHGAGKIDEVVEIMQKLDWIANYDD